MLLRKSEKQASRIDNCHDGQGTLWCTVMLNDRKIPGQGFKFIHDNMLEPGASIGEHRHTDNEELYAILAGTGTMKIDGVETPVGPGDICVTRVGHSHDLTNTGTEPMHFLVICANAQG